MPEVLRSMHPTHPVCAKGKMAEWFTESHHKDPTPYGPHSPFAKLEEQDGSIAGFGFPPDEHISNIHTFEDRLGDQFPYHVYNETPYNFTLIDRDGLSSDYQGLVHNTMSGRHDISILINALIEQNQLIQVGFRNQPCFSMRARHIDRTLAELFELGITLYGKRKTGI